MTMYAEKIMLYVQREADGSLIVATTDPSSIDRSGGPNTVEAQDVWIALVNR